MPYNVRLYDANCFKTVLPASTLELVPEAKILSGREYIVKKVYSGKKPLYQPFDVKKLTFSVKNIIYRNYKDNYCFFSGTVINYQDGNEIPPDETVLLSGNFYNLYKDSVYECEGYWSKTKEGKQKFSIRAYTQVTNSSTKIVEEYLKDVLKGLRIGPVTIKKFVDVFGAEAIEKIKDDVPELKTIIKNDDRRKAIVRRLRDLEERERALEYLVQWGFSVETTISVIESLGTMAYTAIKSNPFILFKFDSIPTKMIDRIAKDGGFTFDNPERVKELVCRYIAMKEKTAGDIYVDFEEFIVPGSSKLDTNSPFSEFVFVHGGFKQKLTNLSIQLAIDSLVNTEKIIIEDNALDNTKKCVYRKYFNFAENQCVKILKELLSGICMNRVPDSAINSYISRIEAKGFNMDILQKQAVKMALQNRISILSGGPGTGKTQTTKAIVDIFSEFYPDASIQLCAPTGKASRRMSEIIGLNAGTLHKALNYIPFADNELNDIKADLLIIDETSMIDIDLFYKVLSHVSENTSILLVGDYNQLPSVGPGLILRDLVDSGVVPSTILTKVFRQKKGSSIVDTAYHVLKGEHDKIKRFKKNSKASGEDFIFLNIENPEEILEIVRRYVLQMLSSGIAAEEIQIITPFNNGSLGVNGLNELMRSIMNPTARSKGEIFISYNKYFCPGDRVIQTENNYDQGVFNGTIGYVVSVNEAKGTAVLEFDGVQYDYSFKDMHDLKLGYAITVHKSQGSEFNYVIMPVIMEHMYVSNRNLLYTAITRAKKKFLLVGQDKAFVDMCDKIHHFSRKSQIKAKLI